MARKPRDLDSENQLPESYAQTLSQMDVVDSSAELINQSPIMPSAVDRDGIARAYVAPPKSYRVLVTQYVMSKGGRTILRAGKVLDSSNFDLVALATQGVQLEEVA